MNDAHSLLAEIELLEQQTKTKMLQGGASHADIQFLFIKAELLAEKGLELYPLETLEFSKKRHHAREGAAMTDRFARQDKLEAAGVEVEYAEETEIDDARAKAGFLRAIVKDLDNAMNVLPNSTKLHYEMQVVTKAVVDAVIALKQLEAEAGQKAQ